MTYSDVAGGDELLRWFGQVPTFHDAEIISLSLNRTGTSELRIHGWVMTDEVDSRGYIVLKKHAVVTFAITDIMDLELDGFSRQNVIGGLHLQRATDRGRAGWYAMPEEETDMEIELLPCYGLDGFIRAKKVMISFVPGRPEKK
ncbi:Imm50 family immunity protein [Rhizobium sp. 2MFCol3.1]|uniref:Imm50 family immunity protein n=1 Tax=Rhizobium sp. 2MFCol3.1 TaxID=1246459 RepID=UPI0003612EFB|nr:Imm50 family immunity protein [Rhizobium sp. 2MFCol3.1]